MKLYHGKDVIDVHPSKVKKLLKGGWSKAPEDLKPVKKAIK